jgi:DNA-binding HxlR family transcriptional regulator
LLTRWKTFDKAKIATILGVIGNSVKHFDEIYEELKNMDEMLRIGSRSTLNQYLKHLMEKGYIEKTLSPVEGRYVAYKIASNEDVKMAIQASEAFTDLEDQFTLSIINGIRHPMDPLDPRAIKVIGQSFSQDPRSPLEYLTEDMGRLTRYMLHELKIQLEIYEKITNADDPDLLTIWVESSFNRIDRTIRHQHALIATLQLSKHYKHKELVEAINELQNRLK